MSSVTVKRVVDQRQRCFSVARSPDDAGGCGTGRGISDQQTAVEHPGRAAAADRQGGERRGETR